MTWKTIELLALLSLSAACSELPEILPDRCGNGLLEAGELCDPNAPLGEVPNGELRCGEPDTFGACHWLCLATDKAPACPAGWTCGPDGLCAYPDGRYQESLESPTRIGERAQISLVDLDGDGRLDLLSKGQNGSVEVRFRTRPGAFSEPLELRPGRPSFGAAAVRTGSIAGGPGLAVLDDNEVELRRVGRARQLESVVVPRLVMGEEIGVSAATPIAWDECPALTRSMIAAAQTSQGVRFFAAPRDRSTPPLELALQGSVLPGDLSRPGALPPRIPIGHFGVGPVIVLAPPGGQAVYLLLPQGCADDERSLKIWRTLRLPTGFVVRADPGAAPRVQVVDEGGDGVLDVIVSAVDAAMRPRVLISWSPEVAEQSFEPYAELEVGGDDDPWPVLRADLDGDGQLDGASVTGVFLTRRDGQGRPERRYLSSSLTGVREAIVLGRAPGPVDVLFSVEGTGTLTRIRDIATSTPTEEYFTYEGVPQGLTEHPSSTSEAPMFLCVVQGNSGSELVLGLGTGPDRTDKRWGLSLGELRVSMDAGWLWVATNSARRGPARRGPAVSISAFEVEPGDLRPVLPRLVRPQRAELLRPPTVAGFQLLTIGEGRAVQLLSLDASLGVAEVFETPLPPELAADPGLGSFEQGRQDLYALDLQGGLTILRLPSPSGSAKVYRGRIGLAGHRPTLIGDIDGNGRAEILFAGSSVLNVVWNLRLDEGGSIQFERVSVISPIPTAFGDVALSDAGLEGRRRLIWPTGAVSTEGPPEARVELRSYAWAGETLAPDQAFFTAKARNLFLSLAVGDLDGDRLSDVALVLDGALHVFLAQRGGL